MSQCEAKRKITSQNVLADLYLWQTQTEILLIWGCEYVFWDPHCCVYWLRVCLSWVVSKYFSLPAKYARTFTSAHLLNTFPSLDIFPHRLQWRLWQLASVARLLGCWLVSPYQDQVMDSIITDGNAMQWILVLCLKIKINTNKTIPFQMLKCAQESPSEKE